MSKTQYTLLYNQLLVLSFTLTSNQFPRTLNLNVLLKTNLVEKKVKYLECI